MKKTQVQNIRSEIVGGAMDGTHTSGVMLDRAPAVVLIITADGESMMQCPTGLAPGDAIALIRRAIDIPDEAVKRIDVGEDVVDIVRVADDPTPGTPADPHVCRECGEGKHGNCDGGAWCEVVDEPVPCECTHEVCVGRRSS